MPELPEVETIARRLASVLPGKVLRDAEILHIKSWNGEISSILGQKILSVTRRAKILRVDFDSGDSVLVHLKMTGQLIYVDGEKRLGGGHPTADWTAELPSKHTRVVLTFTDGSRLFFNDQRIFGWMRLMSTAQADRELATLAPDVHRGVVLASDFYQALQKTRRAIKIVILEGKIVAGVGNIYVCDALHLAKINPAKPAHTLTKKEAAELLEACITVINKGIELGGATIDHFRHVDGFSGGYQDVRRVYARESEACPVCGQLIEKYTLSGRGTYWCPGCQA